ncbi:imidazole glycerol phosphate synthase subunit HisF [Thalassospira xiamenensis]|uniref:imidazole glycerol phosphate synthase subunit HisF n=1 Tax=Thalassospira xiamenensis TaxID=220697 RepID=UPI000DED4FF8|nr:HisA/HisF-related TIM barrel protein [Thalassospira xiamenensis]RCK33567.1 hypothetical protein TH24_21190 [Thalassospira xiamenensis]
MLKVRVIPVLYLMNGLIVRSENFKSFKVIGNPYNELERYSDWMADEVVYVDITRHGQANMRRSDHKEQGIEDPFELVRAFSKRALMPITYGGRITDLEQATKFISAGADKILINTAAYETPDLITSLSKRHGSNAVMVGVDVRRDENGYSVFTHQGTRRISLSFVDYVKRVAELGAGEILLTSIDNDGCATGFDTEVVEIAASSLSIPIIACGGAGSPNDFKKPIDAGASAVAAGNMFHFVENAYKRVKKRMLLQGVDIRYPFPK